MNSRRKGVHGELDLAHRLTELGYPSRRGQQFCGSNGDPDVVCQALEGYHLEVKRTERFRIYPAMEQAQADAPAGATPVVAHRQNGKGWVVVLRLEDFLGLTRKPGL